MRTLELSTDQQDVLDKILEWRAREPRGDDQYFTLGGYAGTGKSTLICHLVDELPNVATVAVCGKAAYVLKSKGVPARTVHSLVYIPIDTPGGTTRWRKRSSLLGVQTIIVDEASMIDHVLFRDLLSFDVPVLFVGDHGQLEPIGTNPRLMANPKLRLETIHRQAKENPIIRLATAFREGRKFPQRNDPNGRLSIRGSHHFERLVSPRVQIVCGYNKTRHAVNMRVRTMLGLGRQLVAPGDKLICLQSNKDLNIFNGQQVTVLEIVQENRKTIELDLETDDGRSITLPALREQFGHDPIKEFWSQEVALLDYGYCLTAHKAQGSEWDAVLVFEEIARGWDARRWRYTVATRAKKELIYCS